MDYLIKSNLNLIVFYLAYILLFRKSSFFSINRIYLLSVPLISFLLPLFSSPLLTINYQAFLMNTFIKSGNLSTVAEPYFSISVQWLLLVVYCMISAFRFMVIFWGIRKLHVFRTHSKREGAFYLLNNTHNSAAFSFFNWVFIADSMSCEEQQIILKHEFTHAKQWHSADVLFYEILNAFLWYNPFVLLLSRELKNTHEYIADHEVIKNISDRTLYCNLLLTKAMEENSFRLSHSFIYLNTLSSRIMMITKNNRISFWRYAILIPVLAVLINFNSCSKSPSSVAQNEASVSQQKVVKALTKPEQMAEFKGGQEAMIEYLSKNIKYPDEARKAKIEGISVVKYIVDAQGKVNSAEIIKSGGKSFDVEALKSILAMPVWIPAMDKGKNVACEMILPISFKLE